MSTPHLPPQPPPPPKKTSGNKGWLAAGLIVLVLIAISAISAPFYFGEGTRDLPEPPDDSDMRVEVDPIPDEENAFHHYVHAVNAAELTEEDYERLYENDESDAAHTAVIEELVEKNASALEHYRNALAAPRAQATVIETYSENLGFEAGSSGVFLDLIYMELRHRFFQGDEQVAIQDALDLALLGKRLMASGGITYFYSEGTLALFYGLDEFVELITASSLPAEQLRPFGEQLDLFYDDGQDFALSLKTEYPVLVAELEALTEPENFDDEEAPEFLRLLMDASEQQTASEFHINRMKTDLLDIMRPLVAGAGEPLNQMPLDALNESENLGFRDVIAGMRPVGLSRLSVLSLITFLRERVEEKCESNTLVAFAQTTLALKLHYVENGALPDRLDALVPDYVDRVPLDDYDGEPIRYDPDRAIVYSVGGDMADDGGDFELDAVWELDFSVANP